MHEIDVNNRLNTIFHILQHIQITQEKILLDMPKMLHEDDVRALSAVSKRIKAMAKRLAVLDAKTPNSIKT